MSRIGRLLCAIGRHEYGAVWHDPSFSTGYTLLPCRRCGAAPWRKHS